MVSIPDFPQKGKKNRFFYPWAPQERPNPPHQVPLSRGLGASGPGPRAAPLPRPSLPRLPLLRVLLERGGLLWNPCGGLPLLRVPCGERPPPWHPCGGPPGAVGPPAF